MITAWHFMADHNGKPVLRDGRDAPAVGEWLVHEGPIQICSSGLHASIIARDALTYTPGPWIARVECDEIEVKLGFQFVCRRRRILWLADATPVLRWFARRCALDVIHLWDAPDVVVRYLRTGDEQLREAARNDACPAPTSAASYAAARAAWFAASYAAARAAGYAEGAAARAASDRAAMDVAMDVAWYAARAKHARRLRRGLMTLPEYKKDGE